MRTWKELGDEFRNLILAMPTTFLDSQWGDAGEHWNIGGGLSSEARIRFETLSMLAGEKLLSLPFDTDYLNKLKRYEPNIRWFQVLKDISGAFIEELPAEQHDRKGIVSGYIYYGRINHLAEVSSNVCLKCEMIESSHPQQGILNELEKVGFNAAAEHWRKSKQYRQASPPDLTTAAGEAIKALEGVAKEIAALPNGTLGDCIKQFRGQQKLSSGITQCLDGIWAYSNTTHGIRHGAGSEIVMQTSEVDFFLDTCAAAIRMLLSINAA
jgi:hypothetical protein